MSNLSNLELVYNQNFDITKGNLIQVSDDFLQYINENEQFVIKGKIQDDLILSTNERTYKLRGINLPTSMLLISQKGTIDLQLSHYLKLQDYDHQYQKIYQSIKQQAPIQQDFTNLSIQQIFDKYGITEEHIKSVYKISLKEFYQFEENIDFLKIDKKRIFVAVPILLDIMRNLLIKLTQKNLVNQYFYYEEVKQIRLLDSQQMLDLVAKKFSFQVVSPQPQLQQSKMEIQSNQNKKKYKVTFQSIYNFILIELAIAKSQYIASQMDQIIKGMLNVYIPIGMSTSDLQNEKIIKKQIMSKYFIQTTKNNTLVRIYYDPLQIQSSLKGRIKFMSTFKNRFTKDQIRGIFTGLVLRENSKEMKQINISAGRKSLDMDDLLLRNFRKFGQLYEIKLILPK